MCVANLAIDEFFSGEDCHLALTSNDRRKRFIWDSDSIF